LSYRAAAIAAAFIDQLAPERDPVEAMENWMTLFSTAGVVHGPLRRTLMNLHPSLPGFVVARLGSVPVDRPLLGRWQMLVRICARTLWDEAGKCPVAVPEQLL